MTGILDGSSILITGGGSGIGRATAIAAAREGAAVIVADLNKDGVDETAALIASAGGRSLALEVDVTDEAQVAAMVGTADDAFGGLDGAFNNAGIARSQYVRPGAFTAETSLQAWREVQSVNVDGVFLCLREELLRMVQRGRGSIINTASVAGLIGLAGAAPYSSSKHAVIGLTKSAANEYAEAGIRINALCPGYLATPMTAGASAKVDAKRMDRVPMSRYGTAEEAAELVVWLLSDRASFCTGSTYTVDGGIAAS